MYVWITILMGLLNPIFRYQRIATTRDKLGLITTTYCGNSKAQP